MKSQLALDNQPAAPAESTPRLPKAVSRQREHLFFTALAVGFALTVVIGFARTYFLRPYFDTSALPPLLHLHGAVFTAWLALYLTQSLLVAANRTRVHRRLGIAGAGLAVVVVVVGTVTAVVRAKHGSPPPGVDPLGFLVIPLGDMVVFSTLVGAGVYFRRQADVHKRLMALAMVSLVMAAVGRLPHVFQAGPVALFGLTDLFIVACVLYDVIALGRVHRATISGGLLTVLSQPVRLLIGSTSAWFAFAKWLTDWVG